MKMQPIFLQLSNKIDSFKSKNEDASWGLIYSYFDFEEAVFKWYKELKPDYDKNGSQALVKSKVRKAIPEAKCFDETLRKRMERSEKIYKLFNSIGKEKIARIKSILLGFILNLTKDEKDYVMAEILKQRVWYKYTVLFLLCNFDKSGQCVQALPSEKNSILYTYITKHILIKHFSYWVLF